MKLLFFDCETTGLDPQKDLILEVAFVLAEIRSWGTRLLASGLHNHLRRVGPPSCTPIIKYEKVIHWRLPENYVLDERVVKMHTENGLFEECRQAPSTLSEVEGEMCDILYNNKSDGEKLILAGNSIHFDRNFIKYNFKQLDEILHYRMLDVSTLKIIFEGIYDFHVPKDTPHRALTDIYATMGELERYLENIEGWE